MAHCGLEHLNIQGYSPEHHLTSDEPQYSSLLQIQWVPRDDGLMPRRYFEHKLYKATGLR